MTSCTVRQVLRPGASRNNGRDVAILPLSADNDAMVFNSYVFIFIYLPLLLAGWFGLNRVSRRCADLFLIGMSLWFYGCFGWASLAVLLISILMNYYLGRNIEGHRFRLTLGIVLNVALLCWFKYATNAITASAAASGKDTSSLPVFLTLALPVGLSFYTFTQISYLVDRFRGEIAQDSFLTYVLYASYFPKLVEGPITRYEEIVPQFLDDTNRRFQPENFTRGLILFILGLGKKVLIADVLSPALSHGLESVYYLDTLSVLVTMTGYVLQLYMDFSGFCEMAMGISRMLNIQLPLNFDSPLRSVTYSGFWRRWHMTLNRFFTQNVYIPLGGSRRGAVRTFANTMLIFLLSGLWHGTGWHYLVWGAVNGLLVFLSNQWTRRRTIPDGSIQSPCHTDPAAMGTSVNSPGQSGASGRAAPSPRPPVPVDPHPVPVKVDLPCAIRRIRTFLLFSLTMIFFAADSLDHAFIILRQLFIPRFPGWLYRMAGQLDVPEFWVLNKAVSMLAPSLSDPVALVELLFLLILAMVLVLQPRTAVQMADSMALSRRNALLVGILAVWCVSSLSGVSTYVYFQF